MYHFVVSLLAFVCPGIDREAVPESELKGNCILEMEGEKGEIITLRWTAKILQSFMDQLDLVHRSTLASLEENVEYWNKLCQEKRDMIWSLQDENDRLRTKNSNLERMVEELKKLIPVDATASAVEQQIELFLVTNQKIQAIKTVRNDSGLDVGLREAKSLVDNWHIAVADWAAEMSPYVSYVNWPLNSTGKQVFRFLVERQAGQLAATDPSVATEDGLKSENTQPPAEYVDPFSDE